ncbi:hypothetical protein Droror1_Dr00024992 [Drosera rotundifolia]
MDRSEGEAREDRGKFSPRFPLLWKFRSNKERLGEEWKAFRACKISLGRLRDVSWAHYGLWGRPVLGIERKGRKTPCFRGDTAARGAQPHGDSAAAIRPSHSHPFTAHHQEITTAGHPRRQKHTFPSLKGDGCHSRSSSPTSVL